MFGLGGKGEEVMRGLKKETVQRIRAVPKEGFQGRKAQTFLGNSFFRGKGGTYTCRIVPLVVCIEQQRMDGFRMVVNQKKTTKN